MASVSLRWSRQLVPALLALAACGDSDNDVTPDAPILVDATPGCDPATVLPSNYRPIALASTGQVTVTTTGDITTGTLDATAGGLAGAADQPYLYVDLRTGAKVALTDLEARSSAAWDVALKRSSLRVNGGDSGTGARTLAVAFAATLAEVTSGPATGYVADDFATDACALVTLPGGEPASAFGEWYGYDVDTHAVTPKPEVYVVERGDGSRTAFRVVTYYGDPASAMRGAYYQVEWKQLPAR